MFSSAQKRNDALLGGIVIGVAGGAAGYFMVQGFWPTSLFVLVGFMIGALLGVVTAAFGGRKFFLAIVAGAILGGSLTTYIGGMQEFILGAATGGTIGGFTSVMAGAIGK